MAFSLLLTPEARSPSCSGSGKQIEERDVIKDSENTFAIAFHSSCTRSIQLDAIDFHTPLSNNEDD